MLKIRMLNTEWQIKRANRTWEEKKKAVKLAEKKGMVQKSFLFYCSFKEKGFSTGNIYVLCDWEIDQKREKKKTCL